MSSLIDFFAARNAAGRVAVLLLCLAQTGCAFMGKSAPGTETTPQPPIGAPSSAPEPLPAVETPPVVATTPRAEASAEPEVPAPPKTAADAAARRLLAFNERIRDFGPADLARESLRLGEASDPATTLELALVLAQTRQTGDLARALTLVEPLLRPSDRVKSGNGKESGGGSGGGGKNGSGTGSANTGAYGSDSSPTPWSGLARLLHLRLLEQRRLEEQAERLSQQTRDMQRRIDQLSNQIDALRAIERSLNTRPGGMPAPPSAAPPR